MVRSVQIEVIELSDTGVVEIHMNNGIVVSGAKALYAGSKGKEAIYCLCIPWFKHAGKEPEADMCDGKGTCKQKEDNLGVLCSIDDQS